MVLVNFVVFVIFEILYYVVLFSCESLWMQITADVGKISKTVLRNFMFIFDELSEFVVIFVSNLIFLAVKIVFSFSSVTMRNYPETFYLYKGHNMAPEFWT